MLIMRRRKGESILIGDDVEIRIISIGRSKVKVGINAPRTLRVLPRMAEVVASQNEAAAQSCPDLLGPAIARVFGRAPEKPEDGDEKTD